MKSQVQPEVKPTDQSDVNYGKIRETVTKTHIKDASNIEEDKEVEFEKEANENIIIS